MTTSFEGVPDCEPMASTRLTTSIPAEGSQSSGEAISARPQRTRAVQCSAVQCVWGSFIPSNTLPNTTCLPSSHVVCTVVCADHAEK
jgi:hypothetical protein